MRPRFSLPAVLPIAALTVLGAALALEASGRVASAEDGGEQARAALGDGRAAALEARPRAPPPQVPLQRREHHDQVGLLPHRPQPVPEDLQPLRVLDQCRIRWGTIIAIEGGTAVVRSRGLVWDGWTVRPGPLRTERATVATDGLATGPIPQPGDVVALHWDRVCDRLDRRSLAALRHHTRRAIATAAPLTA